MAASADEGQTVAAAGSMVAPAAAALGRARVRALPTGAGRSELPRHLAADALRRRMLATADAIAVLLACAVVIVTASLPAGETFWAAALLPVWILAAKLHGLYDRDHKALRHLTVDELGSLVTWSTVTTAASAAILALTTSTSLSAAALVQLWLIVCVFTPVLRGLARVLWRVVTPPSSVLLVGSGPLERATRRKLDLFRDMHMHVAGATQLSRLLTVDEPRGLAERMSAACDGALPDRVIVCEDSVREEPLAAIVTCCREERIKLSVVPPLRGAFGTAMRLSHVAEVPVVEYYTGDPSLSTLSLKRCCDLAIATVALVLTAPLLAVVAAAVKLDSRGPALYRQRRAGLDGRPFEIFKFRTMVDGADERLAEVIEIEALNDPVFKISEDPRVTRVGRFLRRWSLDELPQLANVIRGDMSLVGPRPEQVELTERYRAEHRFRLDARPGMTGPMQVFGRGDLEFDERLAVEREYIENLSLGRDLRILLMTLPVVVSGKGAF